MKELFVKEPFVKVRPVLFSGCLLLCGAQVLAAVPVEDMSTRDVRGDSGLPPSDPRVAEPAPVYAEPQPVYTDPAPVISSGSPGVAQRQTSQAGPNAQMFLELQQLQSEVLQLRGLIEEQAYEIGRLKDLQRSRYVDIDRRLASNGAPPADSTDLADVPDVPEQEPVASTVSEPVDARSTALSTTAATTTTSTTTTANVGSSRSEPIDETVQLAASTEADAVFVAPQPIPSLPGTPEASAQPSAELVAPLAGGQSAASTANSGVTSDSELLAPGPVDPEKQAFDEAYDLMKDQQFEQSIVAYQSVVDRFPGGNYAPDARYWLGELYLMSDQLEDARGSFNQVVDEFPAHQKVPLSLYKLGVVNHRLGGTSKALEYLDDVVVRYPDTPAAGLARTYASELR